MSDMKTAREAAALVYSRRLYHGAGGRARGIEVDDIMAPLIPGVLDDTNAVIDAFLSELEKTHAIVPRELTDALFDAVNDLMPSIFDLQEGIEKHGDDVFYEVFPGPTELWDAMLKAAETPRARG